MKVPNFLTINRYHRIINKFQQAQTQANATQELMGETFKQYREIANDTHTQKADLKRARNELLNAVSYKIRHIQNQKRNCIRFIRAIQKNVKKNKQSQDENITKLIDNLTSVTQYLDQIVVHLKAQKKHAKTYNVEQEFFKLLIAQDKIDDELTKLSNSIFSMSANLSRKMRPAVTRTAGIGAIASALYFASLVTSTIEDSVDKTQPQQPIAVEQTTEPEAVHVTPQVKPTFSNFESLQNGAWHRFTCENMTQSQVIEYWEYYKDKDLYEVPTAENIQEANGQLYFTIPLKIKPQPPAVEPEVDTTPTNSAMLISKDEFDTIRKTVTEKYNEPVPFEYFPNKLSQEELIQACMRFSTVWEGGFIDRAYKDSKGFWTIGIGCLIDGKATTTKDIRHKLKTMGLGKTNAECDKVLTELISQKRKITLTQAQTIFVSEITHAYKIAKSVFKNFDKLPPDLQIVLVDFAFNMGETEVRSWKTAPRLVKNGEILKLANSLPKWKWYKDTKRRAWVTQAYLSQKYTLLEQKKQQTAQN